MMKRREIIETIKSYDTIIIHRHVRPDADALGSQVGLKEIIKQSFPEKNVYAVGEEDPALHFLTRMDEIDDSVFDGALVIICDTANTGRISDSRYKLGDKVMKIDHHPNNDPYGDLLWIDTNASSTSEMIYELYLEGEGSDLKFNDAAARLIYAGIVGDTGRFLFPSTTEKTFQYASELVTYKFDRTDLYNRLYNITENIARLRGYILQHFTLSESGVSTIKITKEKLDKYGLTPLQTGKLIGTLGDVAGIRAWAVFVEEEPSIIRIRIRSKGPIVNTLAAKYNGGGHPLAAGAMARTWKEVDTFIADLEDVCQKYNKKL